MSLRLFVAVDLSPAMRTGVADAITRAQPLAPRAKWVAADAAHATLAFLGWVADARVAGFAAAVEAAARAAHPFEAILAEAGTFGRPASPRVLFLGLGGDVAAFTALHAGITAALTPLGFEPESRPFHPHVTLARARDPRGDRALAGARAALGAPAAVAMTVGEVVLFESRLSPSGARYTALVRAPLGAAPRR
jgi:2'-5' RNA ligase